MNSLEKVDVKDRKILYELDLDSRQSFRAIGRKVGLSKDIVTSRVKKLQEKGIITGYSTIIDYSKLGFSYYRFYFSFQNVSPELKKEIIEFFVDDEHTDSIRSLEGSFDLMVFIFVKNFSDAQSFWHKTLQKYGKYFSKKVFSAYCQEDYYGYTFLLDIKDFDKTNRKLIYSINMGGKTVEIDDLDFQIVNLISQNSRISSIDIANKLKSSTKAIYYRLKKLRELGVIVGYKINIDITKLGYYTYKVDIELNQFDKIGKIIKYFELNPNLDYIFKTIGYVDLEIGLILNNSYQLNQIMEGLSNKYPNVVKNYNYFSVIKTYKAYGI